MSFPPLLLILGLVVFSQAKVPCKTVWKKYTVGDDNDLSNMVTFQKHFSIARSIATSFGAKHVLGSYNSEKDVVTFPSNSTRHTFELLTNPYNCILKWEKSLDSNKNPAFYVKLEENNLITRRVIGNQMTLGLQINNETHKKETLFDSEVLLSSIGGYNLKITSIVPEIKPETIYNYVFEFMGQSSIQNDGPVEIEETIIHEQGAEEIDVYTDSTGSIVRDSAKTIDERGYPTVTESETISITTGEETTKTTTMKRSLVRASRVVKVPAYMSVSVCTVASLSSFTLKYTGEAIVSAPGMNGIELKDALESNKSPNEIIRVQKSSVIIKLAGTKSSRRVTGSHIISFDHTSTTNCSTVRNYVKKWNGFVELNQVVEDDVLKFVTSYLSK